MTSMTTNCRTGGQNTHTQNALFIVAALTIALTLAGCGGNETTVTTTTTTTHFPKSTIVLDAINSSGASQLLIAANPITPDGTDLPAQKLLFSTGVSVLAFCEKNFTDALSELLKTFKSCAVFEQKQRGFWGYFYEGPVHIPSGDLHIVKSYYSLIAQEVKICNADVHGVFGIAFKPINPATSYEVAWPLGQLEPCPAHPTIDDVKPFMQYLKAEKVGIYWSGKHGASEAALFFDDDATQNPYYDEAKAAAVGKAKLGDYGSYNFDVQSVEYNGKSIKNINCAPTEGNPCTFDTGTPTIIVPEELFTAIITDRTGVLAVNLAGISSSAQVELKFDVKTLLDNKWVQPSDAQVVVLGLPMQAFYYTVMDITNLSVEFIPTAGRLELLVDSSEMRVVV